MRELPHAIFIIDTQKERIALAEAKNLGIKTLALVDTNCDPDGIDFPFPGNDDAIKSIKLFTSRIADVAIEGQEVFRAGRKEENSAEEEKSGLAAEASGKDDQGESGSAEADQNPESAEEKVPA